MRKNQVIYLMITNNEKWHYLAVKTMLALFFKIKSKMMSTFIKNNLNNMTMYVKIMVIAIQKFLKEIKKY